MKVYKNGLALIGEKLVSADIAANRGKIVEIASEIVPDGETEVVDCRGKYILPALVDIHTHGAAGYDFNTADLDGMRKIVEFYVNHGVGTVLPTLITDSDQVFLRQIDLICELAKEYPEVKGINLEGPFLSQRYCGAHPQQHLQKPSVDKFMQYQDRAHGFIRMITVAPELPDAIDFISEVTDLGTVVSLGHSNADGDTVRRALDAGAKSFTHWGNAMSQLDRHNLNMSGWALASKRFCEVICDGKHVDREVFKLLAEIKGEDRLVCVTDSLAPTGLPNGSYTFAGQKVTVADGEVFLPNGTRAGSTLDAYTGLANTVTFTGLPLHRAIKMWTVNPAKLVGLERRIGTIEVGKDADFILFG